VDALPWTLARAATLAAPETAQPIAALDWAYGKSTICLVQKGVPVLVRSLKNCAFQDVLTTIADGLRVDERDAELLLQKHGLQPLQEKGRGDVIGELLEGPITRLTQELLRTLEFWRGATRGQAPATIYVFGGGGTIAGIGERLTQRVGVPIESWRLPLENSTDAAWMPPACLLGVAAGLSALAWEAT
jgi:Tfp pilus assembly PilM family ATPase